MKMYANNIELSPLQNENVSAISVAFFDNREEIGKYVIYLDDFKRIIMAFNQVLLVITQQEQLKIQQENAKQDKILEDVKISYENQIKELKDRIADRIAKLQTKP